ncbi:MAG: 7,8-didemethyl-8-hydroxy-5-deazariboflavin synthase subunit CofG [Chloracidobacterium sp.]|uniref:7,8-didemethyl-8-hydroxy-5-deazariboflavin synthase n=1 Tax=Chloracidobacterium validum TaxID=2821543 RepID=A0ABX8BAK5_9BACT|nr:7,8-didemethyl-8-hydroxy-5-deazariboflavin synthase subunit CofG [Chloracidobacterium validum]QUW02699.1 7,8-didemethyl-8-hydroxy-5-deazariboflavin synthase subunit CofG [Chloracidobacterium validum]
MTANIQLGGHPDLGESVGVTYSRSITFIPTYSCVFACGYCAFARPTPLAGLEEAAACFIRGVQAGCHEVLIMSGEGVMAFPSIRQQLTQWGFQDYNDYLSAVCRLALDHGLLPHINIGNQSELDFRRLRPFCASMGMMLETTSVALMRHPAHRHAPGKHPQARLATLAAAGRVRVPFTTGLLVGIGETWADRQAALSAVATLHRQYGHIQEVIIQPFTPHPRTAMAAYPGPDLSTLVKTVRMARDTLPPDVVIQIPPNLTPSAEARRQLLLAGARDFGGISPEPDHINPDEPWLSPEHYAAELAEWGFVLHLRLPVYPRFQTPQWLSPTVYPYVCAKSATVTNGGNGLQEQASGVVPRSQPG